MFEEKEHRNIKKRLIHPFQKLKVAIRHPHSTKVDFDFDFEQVCGSGEPGGLGPSSPYSVQVEGERAGMARCWISCCKDPSYAAGGGTGCNSGI